MNSKIFAFASWLVLGPILDQFWLHFGIQKPIKSVPRGFQNRSKKWSKNLLRLGLIFWRFLVNFGSQLGGPRGPTNRGFGVKSAPGATLGPKWPPGPIQARFLVDLDWFWDDFGSILGRFWGRCWSIVVWLLMDNVTSLTNLTNLTNLTPGTVPGLARKASG